MKEREFTFSATFSLPSPSSDLKVPILAGKRGSRRHSTTSFSENVVSGGNKLSNARSFSILQSGEVSTFFNNVNSANFSGEKKYNEGLRGVYFLTIHEKKFTSNLVLVVIVALESESLLCHLPM